MDEKKLEEINKIVDAALEDALANLSVDDILPPEEEQKEIKEMLIKEYIEKHNTQKENKTK